MTTMTWNRYPERAPNPLWSDNWEDAPERIAHQKWIASISSDPRSLDERQRLHRGLIGPGSFLKTIIKANTVPTVSADTKSIETPRGTR
jgi:hypothetical protein